MTYVHLQIVSDRLDYEFVRDQAIEWVEAIEAELKDGKTPEQIKVWWGQQYKRPAMKERIYHAARHIERELKAG